LGKKEQVIGLEKRFRDFVLLRHWLKVRVLHGSQAPNEPLSIPVERLLASLRFENRGKLDGLGLDIELDPLKSNN
jgi:hypothetical protein